MLIEEIDKEGGIEICTYESSNIKGSVYNKFTRELIIEFSSGKKYKYDDQSYFDYLKFKKAKSQGSVFHSDIKKNKGVLVVEEIKQTDVIPENKPIIEENTEVKDITDPIITD